jgi:predicted regulator of Ras-like GTPase activity (Roadblock/LC7/MglB family)
MSSAREGAVRDMLEELERSVPGSTAALLTRSGSLFAGRTPHDAPREPYAAMMAVLHGASEAGAAEMGEELHFVQIHTSKGAVFVTGAGRKMLLVLHVPDSAAAEAAAKQVRAAGPRLAELF